MKKTTAAVKKMCLPAGTILQGKYLIGKMLGAGGFGITYLGFQLNLDRVVAIKEFFPSSIAVRSEATGVSGRDFSIKVSRADSRELFEKTLNSFENEGKNLASINLPGVVGIYDCFRENSTAYLVMEYISGQNLKEYQKTKGGKLEEEEVLELLEPVIRSMAKIHEIGIIHRDISPDNIRYLTNKRMKLMDFGSAKSTATEHSDSVMILFKPGYTPPEQYASGYMVGPWMDVYAMAATIYRCITGKTPKASVKRENDEDLDSPRSLGADISPEVEQVILRGMALDPEKRYLDMRAFYEALKAASPAPALSVLPNTPEPAAQEALEEGEPFQRGVVVYDEEYRKLLEDVDKKKKNYTWVYVLVVVELLLIVFFLYRLLQH